MNISVLCCRFDFSPDFRVLVDYCTQLQNMHGQHAMVITVIVEVGVYLETEEQWIP